MNAPLSNLAGVDIVEAFTLRAEAFARRYADSQINLHTAVDKLQQSAEASGLVATIGQNAVQAIMSEAFAAVRCTDRVTADPTHKPTAQDNPLASIDWNAAAWDTDAAAHMFARVRELCGAHCGPPELIPEMIAAARQEACDMLEQAGALERDAEAQEEFVEADTFAEMCRMADAKRPPIDRDTQRLQRLLDNRVSVERTYAELNKRALGDVPKATLEAAEYLVQQNDLQRLKDWLMSRSPADYTTIRKHLNKRRGPS